MSRCALNTYRECSCVASGIPCRAAPPAIEILQESNTKTASRDTLVLIGLAVLVFFAFALSAHAGFSRVERAYEMARV